MKVKKIIDQKWKPVVINGSVFNEGYEDLVGIEECTEYELVNNQSRKRKLKKSESDHQLKKKQKKKKKCELEIAPSKLGSTVEEIDEQSNVETSAWNRFGLSELLLKGIRDQGFEYPTEIQSLSLPAAIFGKKDILGAAETGSGKTLAFGLPILNSIIQMKSDGMCEEHPLFAIILTPTRELAIQIKNHLIAVAKYSDISIAVLVGGMAVVKQERVLSKSPEIIVATPGRLWELVQLGYEHLLEIDKIRFLVIDETDRMLERGHFQELQSILEKINGNEEAKKQRQNFVFSATLTLTHELPRHIVKKMKQFRKNVEMTPEKKLKKIIDSLGIHDPKIVDITKGIGLSNNLSEGKINCLIEEKDYYVYYFLQKHPGKTIIFCNSIGCVKRLTTLLTLLECHPLPLHASMQQKQRLKNLERFRDRENSLLIATDVAARGLDIPSVDNVLHYQTPRTSESYIHRSGRTARATKEGLTLLIIDASEIKKYIGVCRTLNKSEDVPNFPVERNYLDAVKERVNLAREVDKLQLQVRKTSAEIGWFEKAAKEMDIIIDNVSLNHDSKDRAKYKKLYDIKRKQLANLLEKPIFPRGINGKYPLINHPSLVDNLEVTENAIDTMKKSVENDTKDKKKVKYYKPRKPKDGSTKIKNKQ
ncbi:ATP-dependent RNA helicase DDX24 [Coccinella septempunctata]|uniref:ATP-dependent RNA helicase DDX24 n=1 Tax=Coccinella septempunctata TaxID=41139 RepID=UPI001D06F617|nr:ATP-dependent RNA helicase DDX24 [Coccinella septempunctata]